MSEINVSEILQTEGAQETIELTFERDCLQVNSGGYKVTGTEPVLLAMRNKEKGRAVIQGKTVVYVEMSCDRCLKPVEREIDVQFEREIAAPELLENDPDQAEDQTFVEGYVMTLEKLLQEEVLMNIPAKILCKEDCKGICKVCGRDLNEGDCGCDDFVPDPRMAVIADLFKS